MKANKRFYVENNIFRNGVDAFLGLIVIIFLPSLSLISTIKMISYAGFANYTFPIISICLCGAYDAYGRQERGKIKKNIKLLIRIIVDILVLLLSFLSFATKNKIALSVPPIMLIVVGCMILNEAKTRIITTLKINFWFFDIL